MNEQNTQVTLFQYLRTILPAHLSMADELADLLDISPDSAYRRIRAEKPISLEELEKICSRYNISMDQLLHLKTDSFLFTGKLMEGKDLGLDAWMDNLIQLLAFINSLKNKHIYFLLKDIPPVEHFHVPELAAFKFYFWMKSILHYESMKGVKFDLHDKRYEVYHEKGKKILNAFNKVPFTEIWNIESINSTLRQIHFHYEAGSFKSKADVILLYNKFIDLINHFEHQAEAGVKFNIGEAPSADNAEYRMFVNELILGDNTFLVEGDNVRLTFLNHSVIYFINTRDETFNNRMFQNLQNLINKSTMISAVGEKERANFFNRLRDNVMARIADV